MIHCLLLGITEQDDPVPMTFLSASLQVLLIFNDVGSCKPEKIQNC